MSDLQAHAWKNFPSMQQGPALEAGTAVIPEDRSPDKGRVDVRNLPFLQVD